MGQERYLSLSDANHEERRLNSKAEWSERNFKTIISSTSHNSAKPFLGINPMRSIEPVRERMIPQIR